MALTASDYIVLNGLGIANSWAQNRMARLSLEQKEKDSRADELFRRDELRQRAEDARLNRENQKTISENTLTREDKRVEGSDERLGKRLDAARRSTWDRMVSDEQEQLREIDSKMAIEKAREEARLKIEQMKIAKDGLTSVGAGIGRLLGIRSKEEIAAAAEDRKGLTQRNAEVLGVYKMMPPEERSGWKLTKQPDGSYSLDPKEEASPATPPAKAEAPWSKAPSGNFKYRFFAPATGY